MSKRRWVLLILTFFVLSGQALAQGPPPPLPTIYVSALNDHNIRRVNPNTGVATVIYSDTSQTSEVFNFRPEGMAIGPDGRIYVCVTLNDKIIRMNQDGTSVETVYQFNSESTAPQPQGPEGPSFDSSGNLFVNTRTHSGVWEIAGAGSVPFGGTFNAPVNVVPKGIGPPGGTGSTFGEGTAFGGTFPTLIGIKKTLPNPAMGIAARGVLSSTLLVPRAAPLGGDPNLLIVDRTGNRVLIWDGVSSVATLIQNPPTGSPVLDTPIGVAVGLAGDIFVANAGTTLKNVNRFGKDGTFMETYASGFTDPATEGTDIPLWLAFDGSGNLFVTTARDLTGLVGSVWKVDPSKAMTNLTASANPSGLPHITGIALASITQPLDSNGGQNTFAFGRSKFTVRYLANSGGVSLTVFDLLTTQEQLTARSANFSGAQIVVHTNVGTGETFRVLCNKNGVPTDCINIITGTYDVFITYDGALPDFPIFLKGPADSTKPYTTNIFTNIYSQRFFDPTDQGTSDGWSDFEDANLPPAAAQLGTFGGFLPPLATRNGRVFSSGDTIAVRFQVTSASNPSQFITDAIARISVGTAGAAQGTTAANFKAIPNNQFRYNFQKNAYEFYLDTTGYAPGTYLLIVTSNRVPLQQVTFTIQ